MKDAPSPCAFGRCRNGVALSALLCTLCVFLLLYAGFSPVLGQSRPFEKRTQADGGSSIVYGLAKPLGFSADKKYPMVVALHGMAPVAPNTLDLNKISGSIECNIWARDDMQTKRPCFVMCPMNPIATWDGTPYHSSTLTWDGRTYSGYSPAVCPKMADTIAFPARCVKKAIDSLQKEFPQIDANRIYIVGGSMGAVGAYCMAVRWPGLFAALWPIAGLCDTARACSLKALPLWTVHGTGDDIVKTLADSLFVKAIVACGGSPKRTWVAGAGHGPFDYFAREEYHTWLFAQAKTSTASAESSHPECKPAPAAKARRLRLIFGAPQTGAACYSTQGQLLPPTIVSQSGAMPLVIAAVPQRSAPGK